MFYFWRRKGGLVRLIGQWTALMVPLAAVVLWIVLGFSAWFYAQNAFFVVIPLVLAGSIVYFFAVERIFLQADEAEGEMNSVLQENVAWGNGKVSVTKAITVQVANFTLRLEQNHSPSLEHASSAAAWILECEDPQKLFDELANAGYNVAMREESRDSGYYFRGEDPEGNCFYVTRA